MSLFLHRAGILRPIAAAPGGDDLADFLTAKSAIIWLDHADATTLYEERTGTPPSTLSDVDDVVGSIFNKGSLGGYARASADGARGVRRTGDYIQVDGSDDRYTFAASYNGSDSLNYTIAVVGRVTNGDEGVIVGDGGNNPIAEYQDGSGTSLDNFSDNHTVDGSAVATRNELHDAMRDVDAVLIFDWNSVFAGGVLSFANHASFGIPMAGRLYQIVVIPSILDSTDRATLLSLLQGRIP